MRAGWSVHENQTTKKHAKIGCKKDKVCHTPNAHDIKGSKVSDTQCIFKTGMDSDERREAGLSRRRECERDHRASEQRELISKTKS